jgi:DNA adenine methylase
MAISYIGGKARIGSWISTYIPTDIETYVEPFSGMFWVFFNMDLGNYPNLKTVVYNDYNRLNSNLFKWIKQYDVLWESLSKYPCQQLGVVDTPPEYAVMFNQYQKEVFNNDLVITDDNSLEIACKYVYVLTQVFSGSKPETATYMDYKGKYRCKVLILMDKLKNPYYREHIDRINFVENMDFEDVIKKYDSPVTYFYVDPPYYKTEKYYSNHLFTIETHERLSNTLKNISGRFGLSYYDFPQLSEWFPKELYNWCSKSYKKAASAKKDGTQNDGIELLIMNYIQNPIINHKTSKKGSKKKNIITE